MDALLISMTVGFCPAPADMEQRASQRAASACLLQLFLEAETDRASGRTRETLDFSAMGWVGELG